MLGITVSALPAFASGMMTDVVSTPAIAQSEFPQPEIDATAQPQQNSLIERSGVKEPLIPNVSNRDYVVILHGIGRTSVSMAKVARTFSHAGYKDDNIGYNSTRDTLHIIIDEVYKRIRRYSDDANQRVHFVCYSLGCLVTRGIIEQHRPANLGRVVMMGPPNQGSELADYLKHHTISNWLLGPNLPQLGTGNREMLERLIGNRANYELGIIAGQDAIDPIGAYILPDADDGRVPVERTKLAGMKEHLVVNANHTTLIMNSDVIAQALHFIEHGRFNHVTSPR
ncbi:MAG: hypothetical protein MK052_10135 [Alphaproteobacteria bacterium]|nr:hypothetical protein [Alphaproteobacteria bacterium]